jgi:hypothetical protein
VNICRGIKRVAKAARRQPDPYNYGPLAQARHIRPGQLTGCSTNPDTRERADGRKFENHRKLVACSEYSPVLG